MHIIEIIKCVIKNEPYNNTYEDRIMPLGNMRTTSFCCNKYTINIEHILQTAKQLYSH